ncbi:MAG TPA: D-alanyl-D-alanine carboxypeptidase/D-alanyl-D-alanine-endopeptidase [Rhodocyclaceae bacterium]|nr:D-alanyl-D-alanine carboxypeptidase/D-alanyl-D-alanine-endopeptidase [Rhodocyclaceae bacterium]HMY50482.1 D-alanyl-D-alanine carboxypeptidase/D-alanyl-D-alanine-endopeptidase [Rhodocyclaceae bacterium]HNB65571.1 D-alanyl-D-alanine carboxypeptidase/D-alanyl-D-alanine-endopeptidase [Rhodocyclaceae bacterium]HNC80928.1 D-alanyl-D-alanine carboxypeptidase/D-alanyl-D-alanine-endopeptidase [Rhodocyclaceae bacterium]HND24986.1 D-alanyl-D-alanine carboxypeptidase/D-alanyl-D-alanine-endopeptidase [Rh
MPAPFARFLFLCLLSGFVRAEAVLPAPVQEALNRASIPRDAVAVWIQDLEAPRPIVTHRVDAAMNPASVMKLVTSQAALELLGPTYVWRTRITSTAPLRRGVLDGDLAITASGDPRLSRERLWLLLRDLRMAGVSRIAGDVITDRSVFSLPPYDPGAFDQRPLRPYNAPADALSVDYSALRLRISPTTDGAIVRSEPLPAGLSLVSRIRRNAGPCADPSAGLSAGVEIADAGTRLVLDGFVPQDCTAPFDWNVAPLTPARLFEGLFRSLWAEMGGTLDGRFRDGPTPDGGAVLAESVSPALPEVLRDMNKWSNNVIARQLFATLGAVTEPGADSLAAGARACRTALQAAGIDTRTLVMENGSGLSRSERASAALLGQLLIRAWHSPTMPELIASLPIAGRDGTARRRLAGSTTAGFAHVKTGTLDDVRSLAGYVLARNGRRYGVVLLINHPNASAARGAQDALLEWVANL